MKLEEANEIIAIYMGWKKKDMGYNTDYCWDAPKGDIGGVSCTLREYCKSLDALVPVWERLKYYRIELDSSSFDENGLEGPCFVLKDSQGKSFWNTENNLTIQAAACIATAKAIKNEEESK